MWQTVQNAPTEEAQRKRQMRAKEAAKDAEKNKILKEKYYKDQESIAKVVLQFPQAYNTPNDIIIYLYLINILI